MTAWKAQWKRLRIPARAAYILVGLLLILIPVEGLLLESINRPLFDFDAVFRLYLLSLVVSLLAKQWKLAVVATVGGIVMYALTLGLSELLWYTLKTSFGIDISYR